MKLILLPIFKVYFSNTKPMTSFCSGDVSDFFEVRNESRFHFVVVTLCDFCEVRTESRFHFVVVTLYDFCEV
jgi:hypothetical protein